MSGTKHLGQGIAIANELLVADELKTGALVEVMSTNVSLGCYQLIALRERWNEPAVTVLRHWLRTVLAPARD